MDIPLIPAKTIVIRQKNGWFGACYNMNIYRGCCHGCIYCDSRSDCYRNPDFAVVKAKANALATIRRDLGAKRKTGVVATGSMSDPYNPFEKQLSLTRNAMELLFAFEFGVAIATKSDLVVRDIDILKDIMRQAPVIVKITITCADDALAQKIEPHAPSSRRRFEVIKALSDNGIYCGVLMMPLLPFVNDTAENVREIVQMAAANGARFVYPSFGVTQRTGQMEYMYSELEKSFPGTAEKYRNRYNGQYICSSPDENRLKQHFRQECTKNHLLFHMSDIIEEYKRPYAPQLALF